MVGSVIFLLIIWGDDMTDIIVEDGGIVTDANSYITVSGVGVYAETYGYSAWDSATDDVKTQSLLKGMRYIESLPFKGYRQTEDQALSFPRSELYDKDGYLVEESTIPSKLVNAVCEAAVACLPDAEVELQADRSRDDFRKKLNIAGVIIEEWYASANGIRNKNTIIFDLLSGYLKSSFIIEIQRG